MFVSFVCVHLFSFYVLCRFIFVPPGATPDRADGDWDDRPAARCKGTPVPRRRAAGIRSKGVIRDFPLEGISL